MDLLIGIAFYLGPVLLVIGLVLLFLIKVWPKLNVPPKAAGWMIAVGFGLCFADFLFDRVARLERSRSRIGPDESGRIGPSAGPETA